VFLFGAIVVLFCRDPWVLAPRIGSEEGSFVASYVASKRFPESCPPRPSTGRARFLRVVPPRPVLFGDPLLTFCLVVCFYGLRRVFYSPQSLEDLWSFCFPPSCGICRSKQPATAFVCIVVPTLAHPFPPGQRDLVLPGDGVVVLGPFCRGAKGSSHLLQFFLSHMSLLSLGRNVWLFLDFFRGWTVGRPLDFPPPRSRRALTKTRLFPPPGPCFPFSRNEYPAPVEPWTSVATPCPAARGSLSLFRG